MPGKILVIEDERPILESLQYALSREGFEVVLATDGETGLAEARRRHPDLIILDLMLPGMDGLEVCRLLRRDTTVPIIMLTAKSEEIDKVVGLEMGADDYITKPFGVRELIARVKSVLRRTQQLAPAAEVLEAGEVKLNKASHTVEVRGKIVKMAPREFDLLALLMSNPGRALSRNVILDRVWGEDAFCEPHTVDVHIRWLREKIEKNPSKPTYIVTVRGVGYRFEKEPKSR